MYRTAFVRQLRTTAAPAIAVEISSVTIQDKADLDRMLPSVCRGDCARGCCVPAVVRDTYSAGVCAGGEAVNSHWRTRILIGLGGRGACGGDLFSYFEAARKTAGAGAATKRRAGAARIGAEPDGGNKRAAAKARLFWASEPDGSELAATTVEAAAFERSRAASESKC